MQTLFEFQFTCTSLLYNFPCSAVPSGFESCLDVWTICTTDFAIFAKDLNQSPRLPREQVLRLPETHDLRETMWKMHVNHQHGECAILITSQTLCTTAVIPTLCDRLRIKPVSHHLTENWWEMVPTITVILADNRQQEVRTVQTRTKAILRTRQRVPASLTNMISNFKKCLLLRTNLRSAAAPLPRCIPLPLQKPYRRRHPRHTRKQYLQMRQIGQLKDNISRPYFLN